MINNKGFTLIELLAVLAILITIVAFAVPSVVSSLNKQKTKDLENRKQYIVNTVELKADIKENAAAGIKRGIKQELNSLAGKISGQNRGDAFFSGKCFVTIQWLETNGFITGNQAADITNKDKEGILRYSGNSYMYDYGEYNTPSGSNYKLKLIQNKGKYVTLPRCYP